MIIQRVDAERLHRYRILRLADLPERGIIALSGDNESGKSAIGEIICFALFGRTYALDRTRIGKLVHWGAGQGKVILSFQAKGRNYQVIRHLARNGEQSARLLFRESPGEPIARGGEAVDRAIGEILGYGFDAYIETLYLAQREITMPQPQNPAVRAMVGVAPLERCAEELAAEVREQREEATHTEGRIAELAEECEHLAPSLKPLESLERDLERFHDREQALTERMDALESTGEGYCQVYRGKGSRELRRILAKFLTVLSLFGALGAGSLWLLLRYQGVHWPAPEIRRHLASYAQPLGWSPEALLLYALIVLGALFLLWSLWLAVLRFQTHRRILAARRLSQALDRIEQLEPELSACNRSSASVASEESRLLEEFQPMERPDVERRSRLQQRILELRASSTEVRAAVTHEIAWLRRCLVRLRSERDTQKATLEQAKANRIRYRELSRRREELEAHLEDLRDRIAVRQLACTLLNGAARTMSQRFSEHLRDMVSRALPQFTEGHYDHLDVDERFQVRVYSSDKRNLLDLDEISSGTQRQIMLALRLGLAQELVSRLVGEEQFVFLDEPFAFFDSRRLRGALRTLSELGGDVVQHWVVAQRFPQDTHMALEIPCGQHPDRLEIGPPETD